MTDAIKWHQALSARETGGHSYWLREGTGRTPNSLPALAVADGSMRRSGDPASTDDGLLLVDVEVIRDRGRLTGGGSARGNAIVFAIPLVEPSSGPLAQTATVASLREARRLIQYLEAQPFFRVSTSPHIDLVVEEDGTHFRLVETTK